jgi:hypothetical protein
MRFRFEPGGNKPIAAVEDGRDLVPAKPASTHCRNSVLASLRAALFLNQRIISSGN